jgi:hypothetical protein
MGCRRRALLFCPDRARREGGPHRLGPPSPFSFFAGACVGAAWSLGHTVCSCGADTCLGGGSTGWCLNGRRIVGVPVRSGHGVGGSPAIARSCYHSARGTPTQSCAGRTRPTPYRLRSASVCTNTQFDAPKPMRAGLLAAHSIPPAYRGDINENCVLVAGLGRRRHSQFDLNSRSAGVGDRLEIGHVGSRWR